MLFKMAPSDPFLRLVLLLVVTSGAATALCYFPDNQTVANQDTPCYSDELSFCCGQGFACMSNGLCKLTEYVVNAGPGQSTYVRGSCSDKNWGANCPAFCVTGDNGDTLSGAMGLAKCDGNSNDQYYCLDGGTDLYTQSASPAVASAMVCTSYSAAVVFQGSPTTVTIIGVQTTTSSSTSSSVTSTATAASSFSTSSSLSSSSNPTTASSSASSESSGDSNSGVAIGAGVGVPLGIIAIVLTTYFGWKYQRAKKLKSEAAVAHTQSPFMQYADHQPKYDTRQDQNLPQQEPVEMAWQLNSPHELPATPRR